MAARNLAPSSGRAATASVVAALAIVLRVAGAPALPVFLAGILIGLPHGAADHVCLARAAGRAPGRREMVVIAVTYLAALAVAAGVLIIAPAVGLAAALAVSAWHFGTSDQPSARPEACALGALPVIGPLAFWPAQSTALLKYLWPSAALVTGPLTRWAPWLLLAAVAIGLTGATRRRNWSGVADIAVLVLVEALLPPLAAFGIYFGLWHSARHLVRLARLGGPGGPKALAREAALPTAASLAVLGGAWALLPARLLGPAILAGLLAISLPHTVIVARLLRRTAPGSQTPPRQPVIQVRARDTARPAVPSRAVLDWSDTRRWPGRRPPPLRSARPPQ